MRCASKAPVDLHTTGVGRRMKGGTALVSYNCLDARYSGDGVILLVSLQSYDTKMSVTFTSYMQLTKTHLFVSDSAPPTVLDVCFSILRPFYWFYALHLFLRDCGIMRAYSRVEPFDQVKWTFLRGCLPGFSGNLSNHSSHFLNIASVDLRKTLDTGVSYSKRGGVIDVTCQSSTKLLYETIAVSLFTRLPTPTSLVTLTVTPAHLLVLCSSPQIFQEKRDCLQSKLLYGSSACGQGKPNLALCLNTRTGKRGYLAHSGLSTVSSLCSKHSCEKSLCILATFKLK